MSNKFKLSFIILFVAFVTGVYFAPYLAVSGMKAGIEAKDAVKLSGYVNFPALKESLKAGVSAKLASGVAKKPEGNPFGAVGTVLTAAFVNPTIDALVTPESLAMIMKGDKPQPVQMATQSKPSEPEAETSMSYESFDRFVVTVRKKGATGEPLGLVFSRDGLFSWKLSALRLPL